MSEVSSPAAKSDFPSTRTQHSRRESYQEQLSPSSASSGSRRRSEQLPGRYDASAGRRAEYADRPGGNHPQRQDRPDHEQTQKKPPQTQQHQQQQQQQQFRPPLQTSASVQSSATTHDGNDEPGSERAQSGSDDKRPPKRPREQYSCVECFRRKQKCDRRFPCNNCIKRRLPERCVPPASARASLSGGTPAPDAIVAPDKPEGRSPTGPRPIKKAKREANDWDNRRIEDLARTTSRIARLERILALQDPTYVEQRLALAEKAIRAHFGGGASPRASTSYRARAGHSRSSSYTHDDIDQERPGDAHIDDYEGFLGTSALDAVRIAPQLQDDNGKSPAGRSPQELLSFIQPSATRRGFPIPSADVHAIRATLPSREQCDRYFDAFFANYNWSRSPIVGNTVRERYRQLFSSVPTPSAIRVDVETLPLVALILSALTLGSVPPAVQPLTSATSHAFFWATKKALVLCETLGLASLDSCWAHGILVRYLDVIRVTRASWHEIGSWIRDALDLGLHRDGSSFRLPKEQVAARRILWWHVLHNDREWSILLGRPLTITFHTTEMPTREDLEPLGFACQTYLLARNRFTACLEAITHCFQERSAPTTSQGGRATRSGSYFKVLEVDDQIAEFVDSLPPYLSPNSTSSGKPKVDTSLDDHHPLLPYYRHLINSEVCFYRSLLHRPYLLRPAVNGKHPFPESRRICVESALNDLRARKEYGAKLTKEETAQAFGGAYAMFNSAIVVGLSLLTAFGLGEKIQHSDLTDRLGYLQDYITQLRRNFEAGNVDAAAERERMVMEILLSRLDAVLPEDAVKSSLGELAAVAAQSSTSIPASFAHTRSFSGHLHSTGPVADTRPDEQQALDSLRMLAGNLPASEDPTVLLGSAGPSIEAARYASQPNGGGGIRSMLAAPIFPSQSDWNGPGLTTIGLGAGGAPTNRIDPYGWLLTPSAVAAQDEHLSSGTARSTPSRADSAAEGGLGGGGGGSGSRSGVVGSSTLGSGGHDPSSSTGYGTGASTPSHAMHQRTASADGILQPAHLLLANGEQDPHFDWEAILQTIGSGWMGDVMAGADGPSR